MNTTTWRQQVNIQDVKWVKWEMTMSVLPYRDEGGRMKPKWKLTTSSWALCAAGVWIAVLLASCSGRTQTDPVSAAQTFFTQHHYFYTLEDIRPLAGAVTPQFYALLNRLSDEGIPMGMSSMPAHGRIARMGGSRRIQFLRWSGTTGGGPW